MATSDLLRRAARFLLVLLAVTLASFTVISVLPGDVTNVALSPRANAHDRAEMRTALRLDQPIPTRYVGWLADAARGDLGRSLRTRQPVADAIRARLPLTLALVLLAQVGALALAVPIAVLCALRRGSILDRVLNGMALGMLAAPSYLVAVTLLAVFAGRLGWFRTVGYVSLADDPFGHFKLLVLPAIALAAQDIAAYMRVLRSDLIAVLGEDHIAFARSTGLSTARIVIRRALRPASSGLVALTGIAFGRMLAGTVLVEQVFGLPGLGRYLIDSINSRDYPAVQGAVVVVAVGYLLVNEGIDIVHRTIDPRVRPSQ